MLVFLKQILLSLDGNEDAIVGALKQSLVCTLFCLSLCLACFELSETNFDLSTQRQLESLGAQRAGLEDMLKEMKRKVQSFPIVVVLKLSPFPVLLLLVVVANNVKLPSMLTNQYSQEVC